MADPFASILDEGRRRAMVFYTIEFAEMLKQIAEGNPRHIVRFLSMRSYARAVADPDLAYQCLQLALYAGIDIIECEPGHERFRMPWGEELCAHCIRDEQEAARG